MYRKLIHYICGTVLVELSGGTPERFFNLCGAAGLEVWGLACENGRYRFYMTLPDFRRIRGFARKARVRVRIAARSGLPFFMQRNRKRKLYAAGLAGFFCLLFGLSLFIWDISFSGNHRYTDDTLRKFLASREIAPGMRKSGVDCEDLEAEIRLCFPEITWVSAQISGTRLLIQVKENEAVSVPEEREEMPCDLVAASSGTITGMIVRSGIPMVSVGDTVEEGQLLVSGTLPVTNDSEEVVSENLVRADADITAVSSGSYRQSFPLLRSVTVDTGRARNGFFVRAGSRTLRFLPPGKEGSLWRTTTEERQLCLFSDFYLPVWWGTIRSRECVSYERYYTDEELEQEAQAVHRIFLQNLSEKGVHIIENNVKILKDAFLCHVEGSYVAEGPIAAVSPIRAAGEDDKTDQEGVLETE